MFLRAPAVRTGDRRAVKLLGLLDELHHVLVGATDQAAGPFPGHAMLQDHAFRTS